MTKTFDSIEGKLTEVSYLARGWLLTITEFSGHEAQLIKELSGHLEALAVDLTLNMT